MSRELLERVLKLVGMLSSSNANEAGAAASQLMRTLKANGLDIHDLTGAIAAGFSEKSQRGDKPDDDDDDYDWQYIIKTCLKNQHRVNEKSKTFLDSMRGWKGTPTIKQQQWLLDIFRRFQ
jgi:hypothetical protein